MSATHHAHRLFDLIDETPNGLTAEELLKVATERLEPPLSFRTCSASELSFDEAVKFFKTRGKVELDEQGRMRLRRSNICDGH